RERCLNNKWMEVRRVDVSENKCDHFAQGIKRREEKFKDNDRTLRKMVKRVKINERFAKH
ncbi:26332_t:CDS:1, partial [Gigaspora margarita]